MNILLTRRHNVRQVNNTKLIANAERKQHELLDKLLQGGTKKGLNMNYKKTSSMVVSKRKSQSTSYKLEKTK